MPGEVGFTRERLGAVTEFADIRSVLCVYPLGVVCDELWGVIGIRVGVDIVESGESESGDETWLGRLGIGVSGREVGVEREVRGNSVSCEQHFFSERTMKKRRKK